MAETATDNVTEHPRNAENDEETLDAENVPQTSEPASESSTAEETTSISQQDGARNDEFSYLQRKEFTSEIYKVEIQNLGIFGMGELKKLFKNKLNLDVSKIKSPGRRDYAFVCFRSVQDQETAIQALNGYKWKGRELVAFAAKASADPLMKRRNEVQNQQNTEQAPASKKPRTSAEATCPLAALDYETQLKQKAAELQKLLTKFTNELKNVNHASRKPLSSFKFQGVEPAPRVNGYRNKNEFTVGKDTSGAIVVGFRLGSYVDGSLEVSEMQSLPHIPDAAKWAASSFQEFVRNSKFLPFSPESNTGHLRQIMVRTSEETGEIMLVPGVYTSNLTEADLEELKESLKHFYDTHEHEKFKCTSLYIQDMKPRVAGQTVNPVEHLSGTTHITDTIQNLRCHISPLSFFQVNTLGANVLYQKAIEFAAPQAESVVLDICCGTGTIALAFAKHCKQVYGVEIIAEAIKDAQFNAAANNIENCKFFTGNADDFILTMVREAMHRHDPKTPLDLIAVVDPPRAGLHKRSIAALRAATAIKRLVYVSCDPARARCNFVDLGRPQSKNYQGDPFFPKSAVAVDMFPHTAHTELIVVFERASGRKENAAAEVQPGNDVSTSPATNTVEEITSTSVEK